MTFSRVPGELQKILNRLKILAFDTSSSTCSVAIQDGDFIQSLDKQLPMQQAKFILPMIHELLESTSIKLQELNAIAFGAGPGSFTGIRIASSVAQGLGLATGLPLISVSSLAALAQTAYLNYQYEKSVVAVDARTNQVYFAAYQANNGAHVELIGREELRSIDQVSLPNENDWYGIGDGWHNYSEGLTDQAKGLKAIYSSISLTARAILMLARVKIDKGEWASALDAHPCYLIR